MTQSQTLSESSKRTQNIKFLYSYGGKILPRPIDGKLVYIGGLTRVLSVDRSITYSELMVKFGESCGFSTVLRCKLPKEDLDVLITIKSDEDLRNLIEEYERASSLDGKIRAVLVPIDSKKEKKISPPTSPMSCFDFPKQRVKAMRCCEASHRSIFPVLGYPIRHRFVDGRNTRIHYYCAPPQRSISN